MRHITAAFNKMYSTLFHVDIKVMVMVDYALGHSTIGYYILCFVKRISHSMTDI